MTSQANKLPLHADLPPIRVDRGGAVRIGNSRNSLDLIVAQYENGMTPEEMIREPEVLAWAASENRILITNNRNTMVGFADQRVAEGELVPHCYD